MMAAILKFGGIALALIGGGLLLPSPPTVVDEKPTRLGAVLAAFGAALIAISCLIN